AHVVRDLERAEGPAALGVRLPLWYPFAVEVRHLFDQVVVLQEDRTIGPYRQRILITLDRSTCIGCGSYALILRHFPTSLAGLRSGTSTPLPAYTADTRLTQGRRAWGWSGAWG